MVTIGASWAGRLAGSLAAVVAIVVGTAVATPQSAEAEDTVQLSLAITELTNTGTKAKDKVSVAVTLTNTGSIPAYGVLAQLWRSKDPIRDQASLLSVAAGSDAWGARLIGEGNYRLVTNSTTAFEPGASKQFKLTATMAQLGFDTTSAAYSIGVDVVATADQSSNNNLVAQVRTFVPMPGKSQVPVTSVVLLSASPTKLAPNLFATDTLSAELSGRLTTLLQAATSAELNWLIDPALLDEVRDQADGYQVQDGDSTKAGTGQQVAVEWLARFTQLDRGHGGRTLFANPDTYGAQLSGTNEILAWSKAASARVDGINDLPLVVIPTGAVISRSGIEFLANSGASAIMASNAHAAAALQRTNSSIPVLGLASGFSSSAAASATESIEQQQLILAETAISGKAGQVRLLTTVNNLTQNTASQRRWWTQRNLDDLLETTPATKVNLSSAKPPHLSKSQFADLNRLTGDFAAYDELVTDSQLSSEPEAAYLRSVASAWISDASGAAAYSSAMNQVIGRAWVSKRVQLYASPRFLMSARSNQFPVTVTNGLTESIRVRVVVTTDNPQRLSVPASDLVTIGPGQSETVNIRPEATANGLITADAHVTTAQGRRVTTDVPLTIEVTELGMVAWVIVAVSAVVLVAATAWRIRQVRRRDRLAAEDAKDTNTE